MADQFSAVWWNDQAIAAGGLDKAAVESLTGMTFPVVWNDDGSIPWDKAWPKQAFLRAPGLEGSGLLLSPSPTPANYPYQTAEAAFAARDRNWGGWNRLVSPIGNVAPGTNVAYEPVLSPTYTPPTTVQEPTVTEPPPVKGSALPPAVTTTLTTGSTDSGIAGTQTFTGGETQPGGGGEAGAPLGPRQGIAQTAAPGSQYADVAAPAPAPMVKQMVGFPDWVKWALLAAVVLAVVWWFRRRRSGG